MIIKYRLINDSKNIGVWVDTIDILNLIKICYNRNTKYYKWLIDVYEKLEECKFDESLIKR